MTATEFLPLVQLHGRTRLDNGCLFMNWTCSGLSVTVNGSYLKARIRAIGEKLPFPPDAPTEYPWLGVTVDEGEALTARMECREEESVYTLWENGDGLPHTLRLIKLTENARGKLGIVELETDGTLSRPETGRKLTMEFVGDSITCGFGNEATSKDALFDPAEENGWITYAATAARELGAEFNCISVSGISANSPEKPMIPMKPMSELYAFTDRLYDERMGIEPEVWDFANHPRDVVLINLGTNDVNPVRFYRDLEQADREEAHFGIAYQAFIQQIRNLNGPATKIICALGPMDYYLFDNIKAAAAEYKARTGDENVYVIKLIGINLMTEGFGAVGHPSAKTHARVGHELAARLKKLL